MSTVAVERDDNKTSGAWLLKAAIFATGLAGIVAEYVMSTLASYLLGNAVLQWTLTISTMLFAMGLGSRLSKYIRGSLLDAFIWTELGLSLVCSVSAISTYLLSVYVQPITPIVYLFAFAIGLLIGLEIPLATRLNEEFEDLRINISSVMEKDYYGALLGGVLFAFVALPYLGLTYTPLILGAINLLVAGALFWHNREAVVNRRSLTIAYLLMPLLLIFMAVQAEEIVLYGEQQKYADRIIYQEQTPYQKIVVTQWKDDFWLYLNGNQQFSTFDEERYHEPLVHPAMMLGARQEHILVLGGGDGLAVREVLKYPQVMSVTVVDLDPAMTRLGREHPVFVAANQNALNDPRVTIRNIDAFQFLRESDRKYQVIIIDLPDPKSVSLARLYSVEFYRLAATHLAADGVMVTQATSPFFAREAFLSIGRSMQSAGMATVFYHNHIPTLGEWGWVLGMPGDWQQSDRLRDRLLNMQIEMTDTRFFDRSALNAMLHFGKGELQGLSEVHPTTEIDLAVYHYYKSGRWDLY